MKKISVKIATCLLAAAMLLPFGFSKADAAASVPLTVRVGLAYGGNAVAGANLLNSEGSGYRLGYYDGNLSFVQLGYIAETGISVVKTQNLWYGPVSGGLSGYSESVTAGPAVGCWHIQMPGVYASFEEAQAAAATVGGFPAWTGGTYCVRVGAYLSSEEANTTLAALGVADAAVAGTSASGLSVVKTGTGTILFQYDDPGTTGLAVLPGLDGSVKTLTWYAKRKYFGGFRYQRVSGGNLAVVNVVDREDYINCVLSQEMSNSWPLEALKAQAVCARSYAATCTNRHQSQGFDLCATTDCQAYPGAGAIGANTTRAAAETAGQYVWYNGAIAETYYASSDGGATEDCKNVWTKDLPYLKGVADPWEAQVSGTISNYSWSVTWTKAELEQKLQAAGYTSITNLASVTVNPTPMGNAKSVTFTDVSGKSQTIYGDSTRIFLKTGSVRFTLGSGSTAFPSGGDGYYVNGGDSLPAVTGAYAIDGSGNVSQIGDGAYVITGTGTEQLNPASTAAPSGSTSASGSSYTFTGTGNGHNVGMSQWGANAMAKAGKNYVDILTFYFTGVEIR